MHQYLLQAVAFRPLVLPTPAFAKGLLHAAASRCMCAVHTSERCLTLSPHAPAAAGYRYQLLMLIQCACVQYTALSQRFHITDGDADEGEKHQVGVC